MTPVEQLIALDRDAPKRIAILGDAMEDVFTYGALSSCQDACMKFAAGRNNTCESRLPCSTHRPGGAANAARQLSNWQSEAFFIGMGKWNPATGVNCEYSFDEGVLPRKERFIEDGKIVFRYDRELPQYGMSDERMEDFRQCALASLRHGKFDGVLLSDYDKGFLTAPLVSAIRVLCLEQGVPLLADARREPAFYSSALIQANEAWEARYGSFPVSRVITRGHRPPLVYTLDAYRDVAALPSTPCVSHVGAGDCFAAHMILGMAHGLPLVDAAAAAYSAGRVYVGHPHHRPPWPHEIRRDADPVSGKILAMDDLARLRASIPGKIVFSNGCFRWPTAGHCWVLDWARKQGEVLVVGINDDVSMWRQRPGEAGLSLAERASILAGLDCVDWVVPFAEDMPLEVLRRLKPDCLVKGHDYAEQAPVGSSLVKDVRIAPESPFPRHVREIMKEFIG